MTRAKMRKQFEVESVSDSDRRFAGWLTVGVKDKQGDLLLPEGFTVKEYIDILGGPIQGTHSNIPLGRFTRLELRQHPKTGASAWYGEGFIHKGGNGYEDYPVWKAYWDYIRKGHENGKPVGLSIGGDPDYDSAPPRKECDEDGCHRLIPKTYLYEVSVVMDDQGPANPEALIAEVNAMAKGPVAPPSALAKVSVTANPNVVGTRGTLAGQVGHTFAPTGKIERDPFDRGNLYTEQQTVPESNPHRLGAVFPSHEGPLGQVGVRHGEPTIGRLGHNPTLPPTPSYAVPHLESRSRKSIGGPAGLPNPLGTHAHHPITGAPGTLLYLPGGFPVFAHEGTSINVPQLAEVIGLKVPSLWLQGLEAIDVEAEDSDEEDLYGRTNDGLLHIYPAASDAEGGAAFVAAHECAHAHWDANLTEEQRNRWRFAWNDITFRMVSNRAAYSSEEGFAEALAYHVLDPSHLDPLGEDTVSLVETLCGACDEHQGPTEAPEAPDADADDFGTLARGYSVEEKEDQYAAMAVKADPASVRAIADYAAYEGDEPGTPGIDDDYTHRERFPGQPDENRRFGEGIDNSEPKTEKFGVLNLAPVLESPHTPRNASRPGPDFNEGGVTQLEQTSPIAQPTWGKSARPPPFHPPERPENFVGDYYVSDNQAAHASGLMIHGGRRYRHESTRLDTDGGMIGKSSGGGGVGGSPSGTGTGVADASDAEDQQGIVGSMGNLRVAANGAARAQ